MVEVPLLSSAAEEAVLTSPWVLTSRRGRRLCDPVAALLEDLDPDHSPLMRNLERKSREGETLTDEDFMEPCPESTPSSSSSITFPEFKRRIEREFDEITEQFKRLSIENPDELLSDEVVEVKQNISDLTTQHTEMQSSEAETHCDENRNHSKEIIQKRLIGLAEERIPDNLKTNFLYFLAAESLNILINVI